MSTTLRMGRRRSAILPTLVIVAVLVVLFAVFTSVWTDRLWYQSFDYGSVFTTMLATRIVLFAVFGLVIAAAVAGNAALAYRLRPRVGAANPSSPLLERYRELLESRFIWVALGVAGLIGLFAGGTASSRIFDYLGWRNATPFNATDPKFGLDISFFVFGYPWWRFVLSFVFATLVVSAIAAAVVHYTMGGLRLSGVRRGASRAAQAHLSILIGLAVVVRGVGYWFDQYGLEITRSNRLFTGLSYTADNATVTAKLILAVIAGICGLLFFANAVLQRWAVPVIGVVLLLLSAIVLGLVYPGAVQYFTVRPNEPDREREYIGRNIEATRTAYGVEQAEITTYAAETAPNTERLRQDTAALPGIRLIDPNVVGPSFEQLQQVRGFYSFPRTLDVDRYTIDGRETDAVVGVREMDLSGVEGGNWNNLKTVYTHGYGLVAAYGNRAAPTSGEPEWIVRDIPPVGEIGEYEPRIYFGELQGRRADEFSIVGAPAGSAPVEFDTPGGGEGGLPQTTTYTGTGGVRVGNLFNRILYAAKFADVNILLSNRVNPESKIIYDRTPRQRVQAAAPWLKVDGDAYPAVVEGRVVWIVDGYTTSNSYPNSERVNLAQVTADAQTNVGGTVVAQPQDDINYMRNSVKAVVDAYDGTVQLFAWDDQDPVLQTWRKAFPGVVKDRAEISTDLLDHLRYPQDLFKVQRQILTNYHVTDPGVWYSNSNLWEVPNDPTQTAQVKEQPFYLSVKWPEDDGPLFSLTTSYVPRGRQNLAAYLAVNADASSPDYGRMRILQMSDSTQIDGPGQSFNAMTTNERVADSLRPFLNQGAAAAQFGNLLTLPLGDGLLYVTPVYTQRAGGTGSYPALRFVIVRFGQSVGIGANLQEALNEVFEGSTGAVPPEGEPSDPPPTGNDPDNPAASRALAEAQTAFEAADRALRAGNLATYQTETEKAKAAVERALAALRR